MEERIARLEVSVEHIQSDISEMKNDIRRLDAKVDDVKDSVAALRSETRDSFAALRGETQGAFAALRLGRAMDKIWWLLIAAALLGVMARGFKWI